MRWIFLVFILGCSFASVKSFAYRKSNKCAKTELNLKDCALNWYGYKIHFFGEKIIINDGVWRSIRKTPLFGDKTEWQKIRLRNIRKQKFIEMYIWSEPEGEAKVQSLHWFLLRLNGAKFTSVVERVVQKRRVVQNKDKQAKLLLDRLLRHGVKVVNKKFYWYFKIVKGLVEK